MRLFLTQPLRCMLGGAVVAGCLTLPSMAIAQDVDEKYDEEQWQDFGENEDPWESMNRAVFRFNDT
ncbi:MAG TPA: hypothetical protein VJY57_09175, partial [Thiopseudomonas sp.]|nr:hypothetical protein [Thiopseudomonas sp.]